MSKTPSISDIRSRINRLLCLPATPREEPLLWVVDDLAKIVGEHLKAHYDPLGKSAARAMQLPFVKKSIYQRITIEEAKARLRSDCEPPWDKLDPGILPIVKILYEEGVETCESCQGGPGHAFPVPTVCFYGEASAGWKALSVALQFDLKPMALRRSYYVKDGEPVGPEWEMTFRV